MATNVITKKIAKYPIITGDKAIFPATAAATTKSARKTSGKPTRFFLTSRSRLNLRSKFDKAKQPITERKAIVYSPERIVRFMFAAAYIARHMPVKIIMEICGACVNFMRWVKNAGSTWSRESCSMDPHDEIMPVSTPIINHAIEWDTGA